jgi:hypothetical protein
MPLAVHRLASFQAARPFEMRLKIIYPIGWTTRGFPEDIDLQMDSSVLIMTA